MARLSDLVADTRPLRNPHFRRLWVANIVTVIGAQLTVVAVPAQIYAETGLVGVRRPDRDLRPGAAGDLRPVRRRAGRRVRPTHHPRRHHGRADRDQRALLASQAALGGTNVWVLLSLFAVQQAFFGVNQPTRSAVLPKIVPLEQLPAADGAQHHRLPGGGDRGAARGRRADPGGRYRVALPGRRGHPARHPLGGGPAAEAARPPRARRGARPPGGGGRVRLPAAPARAADVLRRRPDRDDLRHAPGAVPGDRARRLRRARRRWAGVRAAASPPSPPARSSAGSSAAGSRGSRPRAGRSSSAS